MDILVSSTVAWGCLRERRPTFGGGRIFWPEKSLLLWGRSCKHPLDRKYPENMAPAVWISNFTLSVSMKYTETHTAWLRPLSPAQRYHSKNFLLSPLCHQSFPLNLMFFHHYKNMPCHFPIVTPLLPLVEAWFCSVHVQKAHWKNNCTLCLYLFSFTSGKEMLHPARHFAWCTRHRS